MPLNYCTRKIQLQLKYSISSKARGNSPFEADKSSKVYAKNYSSCFTPVSIILCTKFRRIYTDLYLVLHSMRYFSQPCDSNPSATHCSEEKQNVAGENFSCQIEAELCY